MLHHMLRAAAGNRGGGIEDYFANAEKGIWYDPYDLSTMFQDTGATVAVTADGDPVKYLMDKSGNAVHLSHSTGLIFRTDGTFNWLEFNKTYLIGASSRAKMAFAHGGLGYSGVYGVRFGTVANPDDIYMLYSNGGATGSKTGINGWYDDRSVVSRNDQWYNLVGNSGGGGVGPVIANTASGFISANVDHVLSELVDPDGSPLADRHFLRFAGGTDQQNNTGSATPSTANPTDEFSLGSANGSLTMTGRVYQFVMVEGQITSTERINLENLVMDKTP